MSLIEIANQANINCDDLSKGTDKEICHKYISTFYEEKFLEYRDKPIKLLEIGIAYGGSLWMWQQYFTKGTISGMDIEAHITPKFKDPRINYYLVNAYDVRVPMKLDTFDIIIDDGPHTADSQIAAVQIYYHKLNTGGIMVIEDIFERPDETIANIKKLVTKEVHVVDNRSIASPNSLLVWFQK